MNASFEMALKARLLWMEINSLTGIGGFDEVIELKTIEISETICELSYYEFFSAENPKYLNRTPPLFEGEQFLIDCYHKFFSEADAEIQAHEEERREFAREKEYQKRQAEQREQAKERIARGAWDELGLPSPEELSETLYRGEGQRVGDHFVDYDASDNVTWIDNPYGVTGALGAEPTVDLCRGFLRRIAMGGMYGPEP